MSASASRPAGRADSDVQTPQAGRDRLSSSVRGDRMVAITLTALRIMSALVLLSHAVQRTFGYPANPARAAVFPLKESP